MRHLRPLFALFVVVAAMMVLVGPVLAEEKININTASKKELTQMHRIGPALAERIIRYREEHGLFRTPGDMTKVSGIGAKTFEMNKDRIIVGAPEQEAAKEATENKVLGTDEAEEENKPSADKKASEG